RGRKSRAAAIASAWSAPWARNFPLKFSLVVLIRVKNNCSSGLVQAPLLRFNTSPLFPGRFRESKMDLAITLDQRSATPLHKQLYDELRRAILTGRLKPGERVPSTRGLSQSLGVSRATVTQSYEQLLSEGYLRAASGSGTFVGCKLPDELLKTKP